VSNLASLLEAQGKLTEAEPLFRRALEGRERQLGAAHPDTLSSASALASLLQLLDLDGQANYQSEPRIAAVGTDP
jgi:hypothetical protein